MKSRLAIVVRDRMQSFCTALLLVPLLFSAAQAQSAPGFRDPTVNQGGVLESLGHYRTNANTSVMVFTLFAERTSALLDRQAVLKLVNLADNVAIVAVSDETSKGVFLDILPGRYALEVSAVGYLSEYREMRVIDAHRAIETDVILKRDPTAINLDVSSSLMPPKARKQVKHAISALKSGDLNAAQKQLDQAYKLAPSSPDLNFLLGYLYFAKSDFDRAGSFLGTAATLNPSNGQALALLGRTDLQRKDYPAARSALERAVLADADNWLSHDLLADTYLRQRDYGKARDEATVAIAKGKAVASPAELVLGQALVGLGHEEEGIQALHAFLDQSPKSPMAEQVRSLITEINERKTSATEERTTATTSRSGNLTSIDSLAALEAPAVPGKPWAPPGVDDVKPQVASGAECPAAQVIEESGKRIQELVSDLSRFAAVEDLFHQPLDPYGIPIRTEIRKYDYVAAISERAGGLVSVDEFRTNKLTLADYPDQISSTGFITLALVFHPSMRDDFVMECEGLGDWHGQASWLVHFRQRKDRPNHMHSYKVGEQVYRVDIKGRAWITADKFQIVRIEADLVKPMPEIRLISEHQAVEYGPVPFASKKTVLWLPKTAEIYFDFRKHRYYRRHRFDHYMLFSVDADEKRKDPKG
jgi:tetratricopeptide (TPR) repeat protein